MIRHITTGSATGSTNAAAATAATTTTAAAATTTTAASTVTAIVVNGLFPTVIDAPVIYLILPWPQP